MPNFKERADEEEIMDDFNLKGEELEQTLRFLEKVNRFLGGYGVLLTGIEKVLQRIGNLTNNFNSDRPITIMDAGCGSGDSLREIAKWNRQKKYSLQYIGVDANEFIVEDARQKSAAFSNMTFQMQDIFSPNFTFEGVDVVVCGLFLHHLTEAEQLKFIAKCFRSDVQVILVNDLHRHWLGYYLFQLICRIFSVPHMVKHDGLLSIRKAFKRSDLQQLMHKAGIKSYSLRWKWAFRFQLIAYNK